MYSCFCFLHSTCRKKREASRKKKRKIRRKKKEEGKRKKKEKKKRKNAEETITMRQSRASNNSTQVKVKMPSPS